MRIGRKVTIKAIQVRGNIFLEQADNMGAGQSEAYTGRIMLIWDSQPNGTAASAADIWAVPGTPHSYLNLDSRDRFKVLRSEAWSFDPILISSVATQSVAAWNRTNYCFEWYLRNVNLDVIFNGTNGGTIADIVSGALLMAFLSDTGADLTDVQARWISRVRFEDD